MRLCKSKDTVKKVKKANCRLENLFAKHLSHKGDICRICQVLKTIRKKGNTKEKWATDTSEKTIFKGPYNRKNGQALLVAKGVQVKITMRYHYIPTQNLKWKSDNTKRW